MGLYAKAERLIQQAVDGNLQLLGANHPDTLKAQAAQVNLWNLTSRLAEAAELGQKIVARVQSAIGPEHMVTLDIRLLLAQKCEGRSGSPKKLRIRSILGCWLSAPYAFMQFSSVRQF